MSKQDSLAFTSYFHADEKPKKLTEKFKRFATGMKFNWHYHLRRRIKAGKIVPVGAEKMEEVFIMATPKSFRPETDEHAELYLEKPLPLGNSENAFIFKPLDLTAVQLQEQSLPPNG